METNDIAVSVLMIAYNHGNYIAQALDSVFSQRTNFKYEVIVGEDCSPAPDRGREILLEYKKKYGDQLILVLHEHNVGPSENVLSVQMKARGKYLCSLECDDYWTDEQKLQRQYDLLETHPEYSACGADSKIVSDSGEDMVVSSLMLKKDRVFTLSDYKRNGYTVHTNTLMRRASLFPMNNPKYIQLRRSAPTMGDILNFSISYVNGPIYVFKDVMHAHRDGQKMETSFSKRQETKIIYYSYMQMKIADSLQEYFDNKVDFSFIIANRLAEVLVAYVFARKKIHIERSELVKLFQANTHKIRWEAFFLFLVRVVRRGSKKLVRSIQKRS